MSIFSYSLYGIILHLFSLSETPGLNSVVTVPFTCVWSTLYGPLICSSTLQGLQHFLSTHC